MAPYNFQRRPKLPNTVFGLSAGLFVRIGDQFGRIGLTMPILVRAHLRV